MRKLYPQALRAEQAVQELRTKLLEAEAEGQGQRRQLLETDRQIRDLHGRLGEVQKKQRDISHELYMVTLETEESQQSTRHTVAEAEQLAEAIASSNADCAGAHEMLEEASAKGVQEREMMWLGIHHVIARQEQLAAAQQLSKELSAKLATIELEGRGLAAELRAAAEVDARQRASVSESQSSAELQSKRAAQADVGLHDLRSLVAQELQESRKLQVALIHSEHLDQQNTFMRESLDPRRILREELQARLMGAEVGGAEAHAKLVEVEEQSAELGATIANSEDSVQDTRWELDQIEDGWRMTEATVSQLRRECAQLEQGVQKAELGCKSTESDVHTNLTKLQERQALLIAEEKSMKEESVYFRHAQEVAREETSYLEEQLKFMESDAVVMTVRKTECVQAAMKLQEKPACVLC
mmetsp:Transcript_104293/g.299913  ORF Transcript_104293/g.299913 Transcript_104293/m.299913 type:complete len:413 (+) Transcript_104293:120-1358(+)